MKTLLKGLNFKALLSAISEEKRALGTIPRALLHPRETPIARADCHKVKSNPVTKTIWGIIPCCGKSRRMGTPKPMLRVGNQTFLERAIITLKRGGCERVLVCLPEKQGPLTAKALEAGGHVLHNANPARGPISSLQIGIKHFIPEIEGALFCPVDYPLIKVETIQKLIDNFQGSDALLSLPIFKNKRGHPVIFHKNIFEELLEHDLSEGARTVVLKNLSVANLVNTEDSGVTIDIDDMVTYRKHFPNEYRHRFSAR